MPQQIPQDDLKVEKIAKKHKTILEAFKTDNIDLRKFIVEDALRNQELSIYNTYLWFYKPKDELVAYITILADAVGIHGTALSEYFQDKGIHYKTLPALKIGRVCVHKDYSGKGIGTHMIDFATVKALNLSEEVGCRFISTDAKREAVRFYRKNEFEILKAREKGTISMCFDIAKQIEIRQKRLL